MVNEGNIYVDVKRKRWVLKYGVELRIGVVSRVLNIVGLYWEIVIFRKKRKVIMR